MTTLHIEHKVKSFEHWKKAFDSDPIGRKQSKVISHRVFRSVDDPDLVIFDLEFANLADAESALAGLRILWGQVDGKLIFGPQAKILEQIETVSY